jgi:hypothetical protein
MPAKSEDQRKLAGIALSMKRGETKKGYSGEARKMASSMSESELHKMASKSGKSSSR